MTRRNLGLGLALTVTLIATVWAARVEPEAQVAAAVPAKPRSESRREDDGGLEKLAALAPRRIEDDGADVFRVVAPIVVARVAVDGPPAKASAPPLPWRYVGRMEEGGQVVVLLSAAGKDIAVKRGEIIDNTYRVEEIGEKSIVLTFMPLQQRQTVVVGEAR